QRLHEELRQALLDGRGQRRPRGRSRALAGCVGQEPASREVKRNMRALIEAIALRLRLGRWVERRSLPDLLRALTAAPRAAAPVPVPEVEEPLRPSEPLFTRLRVLPDTCLYRSLARYAVLRRAGHPARFVMGIRRPSKGEITGHAWVEIGGAPAFE